MSKEMVENNTEKRKVESKNCDNTPLPDIMKENDK